MSRSPQRRQVQGDTGSHNNNCATAKREKCGCTGCGSALHGWKKPIDAALDGTNIPVNAMRAEANERWGNAFKGKTRVKPSYSKKIAGLKSVAAELTRHLFNDARNRSERTVKPPQAKPDSVPPDRTGGTPSGNKKPTPDAHENRAPEENGDGPDSAIGPDPAEWSKQTGVDIADDPALRDWIDSELTRIDATRRRPVVNHQDLVVFLDVSVAERVELLGTYLHDSVLPLVELQIPEAERARLRLAFTDHLWCGILAETAHFIDTGVTAFNAIPDRLVEAIYRTQARRSVGVNRLTIKLAVGALWRLFTNITTIAQAQSTVTHILQTVRILGFLICKAPEGHAEVVRYCVDPLHDQLIDWVKKQAVSVLPEWLPLMVDEVRQMESDAEEQVDCRNHTHSPADRVVS